MRILLSTEDLIELVTKHAFTSLVPTAKAADVEVGILDGQIVAAVAVYFGEYLLENIHKMNLVALGAYIIIGYLVVLIVYSVLTYIQYSVKYHRAKKSVREYYGQLTSLSKIYAREERKASGKGAAGGYRK